MQHTLTWVEVSRANLKHNIQTFRDLVGPDRVLCMAVKANAYGHGLRECAPVMVEAGADWLGVNALFEAVELRTAGVRAPIYIMGYVSLGELAVVVENGFHLVVYNLETLRELAAVCARLKKPVLTHLKVETGIHRQGVLEDGLDEILKIYRANSFLQMKGVAAHFANIEDTTEHSFAEQQLGNFEKVVSRIRAEGFDPQYIHIANTAATILFPETFFTMVRVGIGSYGLWPSEETRAGAARNMGVNAGVDLKPVLTWKTRVAQVKKVPAGAAIGYGCTYKVARDAVIAVLPVGYYDGYDRGLSNKAEVLVHGVRAPVRGRVCMNMMMVDVTGVPDVRVEDEVVLLGDSGSERISVEEMAAWAGTINYEVTTRINERIARRVTK